MKRMVQWTCGGEDMRRPRRGRHDVDDLMVVKPLNVLGDCWISLRCKDMKKDLLRISRLLDTGNPWATSPPLPVWTGYPCIACVKNCIDYRQGS
jgi:hypothetical protein